MFCPLGKVLGDNNIIPKLSGEKVWQTLLTFTNANKHLFSATNSVPTMDKDGNAIQSEVGGL